MRKFLTYFLLTLSLLSLCALTACGQDATPPDNKEPADTSDKVTYTVSLTCEDNTALFNGIYVQLKNADGTVAGQETPKGGKATFSLDAGEYTVNLVAKPNFEGMLDGLLYELKTVTKENPSVTIDITSPVESDDTIPYTLTVLDKDGNPAANLLVQLCGGPKGQCFTRTTDENGVAAFSLSAGVYAVHIDTPPAGNTFDNTAYQMTEEGGTLTVHLTAA